MARRSRILIVAHDEAIRELMQDILSERFDTSVAEDVLKGTDLLLGDHHDLVIVEDSLPVLSGREYMDLLEASADFPSLPVLIVSAALELEEKCKAKPHRGFLRKPFALDQLSEQVQRLLQPRRPQLWATNTPNTSDLQAAEYAGSESRIDSAPRLQRRMPAVRA